MANIQTIGGYLINVTNLSNNRVLFFNGREWVAVPIQTKKPTTYPLAQPKITNEYPFSMDGIPVIIQDLQVGDVLTLASISSFNSIDSYRETFYNYQIITNVQWDKIYSQMDSLLRPLSVLKIEEEGYTLVPNKPKMNYELSID